MKAPVEVNGKKVDVTRTLTLTADDRGIDDVVQIKAADPKTLEGLKLGLGIRNLPKETWNEDAKVGYAYVDGDGNQKGTDHLGIGLAYLPSEYVKTQPIADEKNGGHIIIVTPPAAEGALSSRQHLGAYWNGDGEVNSKDAFQAVLINWAKVLQAPPKMELGAPEHAK
jgi:hypothetical protein